MVGNSITGDILYEVVEDQAVSHVMSMKNKVRRPNYAEKEGRDTRKEFTKRIMWR
jgi:hypothetical protein